MRFRTRLRGSLERDILLPPCRKGMLSFLGEGVLDCLPPKSMSPWPSANQSATGSKAPRVFIAGFTGLAGAARSGNFPRFNSQRLQLPPVPGWEIEDVWKVRQSWPPVQPLFPENCEFFFLQLCSHVLDLACIAHDFAIRYVANARVLVARRLQVGKKNQQPFLMD